MYTLLDSCLDRLDIFEFLNHVEDGLKDHYDIKMLTYLMLVRLSHLCPNAVLQSKLEHSPVAATVLLHGYYVQGRFKCESTYDMAGLKFI